MARQLPTVPLLDWFMTAPENDVILAVVEDPSLLTSVRQSLEESAPGLPAAIVRVAIDASSRSTCRSKRGAVAFMGPQVVSFGWNYKPDGSCDGSEVCKATCKREAVHAEQMVAISAAMLSGCDVVHVKSVNGELVASGTPCCLECSKLLMAAGVAAVWLFHDSGWRRYEIAEFHRLTLETVRRASSVSADFDKSTGDMLLGDH